MSTDVYISIPSLTVQEGGSFVATAYFRTDGAGSASTTAKYRVDCLETGKEITDWTSLTPAASIAIPVTATHNAIQSQGNKTERKQIVVASDPDATDQRRDVATWVVENIANVS